MLQRYLFIHIVLLLLKSAAKKKRRYLDTLELNGPSMDYDDLFDYDLYEPDYFDFYEPDYFDLYEPDYIDFDDLFEPSMNMMPMVPTSKPRKLVQKRKVTKSQNVEKAQVSKDNTRKQMPKPSKQVQEKKAPNVDNAQISTRFQNSSRQASVATRPLVELIDLLSVPSSWSRKCEEYEVHEERISRSSMEGMTVLFNLLSSSITGHTTKITRVQNPFLYHRYQLRKEEYKARGIPFCEKTLLHATCKSKVSSILKNNLDWRLVNRSKFGKGVSFSPDPMYANKQSSRSNGPYRAMIVAKVLIGRSHGGSDNRLPNSGYDTTTGNGDKVYVKYYDDEFYPEYVIYYNF